MKSKSWWVIFGTIMVMSLGLNLWQWRNQQPQGELVVRVIDGDTFETENKNVVRFDSFDAPELVNCGGEEAKKELEKLILGKRVKVEAVIRDVNGRAIASVWMGSEWVDKKMIESGWVKYASTTISGRDELKVIDDENENTKKGLMSENCTQYENKDKPKCYIKGNISSEWETKGEKSYHIPGCRQYATTRVELWRGESWFCIEKEAMAAGYKKSGGCK